MFKAVTAQLAAHGEVGVCLCVVVGQSRVFAPHFCGRLKFKSIAGKVGRLKRKALRKRVEKHLLRLTGQAVHKVKTDIVKAAAACEQHGVFCFFEVVNAADAAQLIVVGGLHTEGEPIRAGGKQRL